MSDHNHMTRVIKEPGNCPACDEYHHRAAERLLAHVRTADTRWFKVSLALLNWGRKGVPENSDSRNPVKWLAAEIGLWMEIAQTRRTNRKLRPSDE